MNPLEQKPVTWLAAVAVITLLAVYSWQLLALVGFSLGCFIAYNRMRTTGGFSRSPRCLKCGEPLKATERWCRVCGSASWTR